MWYVIVLALSICSSCWAMDDASSDTGSDGSSNEIEIVHRYVANELSKYIMWGCAITYHTARIRSNPEFHGKCLEYLESYKENAHNSGLKNVALSINGSLMVHSIGNQLAWLPHENTGIAPRLLKPDEEDAEVNFISCTGTLRDDEGRSSVWGVDNQQGLHSWFTFPDPTNNGHIKCEECIPGTVTAIRETDVATAIFFDDKDSHKRVGLAVELDGYIRFIPTEERDVTEVRATFMGYNDGRYYKFIKSDGSSTIYYTAGAGRESDENKEKFLKRVTDPDARRIFE